MPCSGHERSAPTRFAGFGDFVLSDREEILRSRIVTIDQHVKMSASDMRLDPFVIFLKNKTCNIVALRSYKPRPFLIRLRKLVGV